jgi:UDP-N-acetylmuramyl pentapeptide phosphotransferase/UDP-N-acetylglucosamine-1-phosphate transferase
MGLRLALTHWRNPSRANRYDKKLMGFARAQPILQRVGPKSTAMIGQAIGRMLIFGPVVVAALFVSMGLILLLRPLLARHALARPNARSSHIEPTPQGGGIAVVVSTLTVAWAAIVLSPASVQSETVSLLTLTAATAFLAGVGAIDDMRSLTATVRLFAQFVAVGAVVAAIPHELQLLPQVPWWTERIGLVLGGVWLVNLVNFMDGIDWMTVAELVPVTGVFVLLGVFGAIGLLPAVVAAALLGAILGFAPFNKPVARLFLGDVGSLPIGLLLGWLLLQLAISGHFAAAIILPLYYLADATITLVRRVARGEPFWQAHRTHFYQRANKAGFSIGEIITRVFAVNVVLAALALMTVAAASPAWSMIGLGAGVAIASGLLLNLARGKRRPV